MELKEVINSGILESYVLGTASVSEIEQVHLLMELHPELLQEIERIEHTLLSAAGNDAPALPEQVKHKLMSGIFPASQQQEPRVVNLPQPGASSRTTYNKYGMVASVVLLVTSAVVNVMLYNKLHQAEQTVASLNQEKSVLAQQMEVSKASLEEAHTSIALMSDTLMKTIRLKGLENNPSSMAYVYWDPRTKAVYLNVMDLPAAPEGKQYQLWALAHGKPIDAGVFSAADTLKLQKLKEIMEADAFAVTLEKEGGNPTPTLSAM